MEPALNEFSHLKPEQAEVIRAISEISKDNSGVEKQKLASFIRGRVQNLDEVLNLLVSHGFLFIGDDSNTYYVS